ncbi:beta-lactamase/transpeptidase-like protein [Thozetella sp. PMI_491]|nr:beta-lactamase/transpeptidase-like protein [Thozetella sp. PMI_491]
MLPTTWLATSAFVAAAVALECHPQGSIVPRPRNLKCSKPFQDALSNLTETLQAVINGDLKGGWDVNNTSMSIGIISLDQDSPNTPLWEFHHLGSGNVNGTTHVDARSQYLIGSISKVISDAILLKSGVNVDDSITKYLPSLADSTSKVSWSNVTLRALASQLAGMPPNYGFSEYYYIKEVFEALGLPHLDDSAYADCGVIGLNGGCTKEQFLQGMLEVYPIAPPMERPVYSNIAFTLYVYALEAHTGKDYATLVQEVLGTPYNMPDTFPSPGNDSLAVIPPVDNSWGSNYADNAPGGGLVSTLADLSSFMHAILDKSIFETETKVREWVQPRTFAGSPYSFVGAPWEIYRPLPGLVFPNYNETSGEGGHTVTIFAKDGAAYGYHARFAVLDEYGVGFVILTAGDATAVYSLDDTLLYTIIQAADAAANEQAASLYVGSFVGDSTAATGSVSINATTELDGVSMKLTGLHRNGSDILEGLQVIWTATMSRVLPSLQTTGTWRLYPADIHNVGKWNGQDVVLEDWRIWFDMFLETESELPGHGIAARDCLTWTIGDWIYYGSEPVDRVVFVKDAKTGEVLGLDAPFLRTDVMSKIRPL